MQLLILLYTAIDTMAWVGLEEGDVTRTAFKDWVNEYLLPFSELPCTADDLYSARCGLVHSHTPESNSTNKGIARQIWYYGSGDSEELLRNRIGDRTDVVAVHYINLILAFQEGTVGFIADLDLDPQRGQKALERAVRWMGTAILEAQTSDTTNEQATNTET